MQFEVEQKHRVQDVTGLLSRLTALGVIPGQPFEQRDRYFNHPARDFARSDEALRIRTSRGRSYVTYKGPKLDTAAKTRRELELPLDAQDADGTQFAELLSALGFAAVAVVRKRRRTFFLRHGGREILGALDEVEGLGSFVELELPADDATLDDAQRAIAEAAESLGLGPSERRSYLELLLARRPRRPN